VDRGHELDIAELQVFSVTAVHRVLTTRRRRSKKLLGALQPTHTKKKMELRDESEMEMTCISPPSIKKFLHWILLLDIS